MELYDSDNQELYDNEWKMIVNQLAILGEQIESIGFTDKPSYSQLRQHLKKCRSISEKLLI